jgi:hypothetical protein
MSTRASKKSRVEWKNVIDAERHKERITRLLGLTPEVWGIHHRSALGADGASAL